MRVRKMGNASANCNSATGTAATTTATTANPLLTASGGRKSTTVTTTTWTTLFPMFPCVVTGPYQENQCQQQQQYTYATGAKGLKFFYFLFFIYIYFHICTQSIGRSSRHVISTFLPNLILVNPPKTSLLLLRTINIITHTVTLLKFHLIAKEALYNKRLSFYCLFGQDLSNYFTFKENPKYKCQFLITIFVIICFLFVFIFFLYILQQKTSLFPQKIRNNMCVLFFI